MPPHLTSSLFPVGDLCCHVLRLAHTLLHAQPHATRPFLTILTQSDRSLLARGLKTTPSRTYRAYTRTYRHQDVPSCKKKEPHAQPVLSAANQRTVRQRRNSIQSKPPHKSAENFSSSVHRVDHKPLSAEKLKYQPIVALSSSNAFRNYPKLCTSR